MTLGFVVIWANPVRLIKAIAKAKANLFMAFTFLMFNAPDYASIVPN